MGRRFLEVKFYLTQQTKYFVLICVTWSREMSHMLAKFFCFQFLILTTSPFKMHHFDPNPITVGHPVVEIHVKFFEVPKQNKTRIYHHLLRREKKWWLSFLLKEYFISSNMINFMYILDAALQFHGQNMIPISIYFLCFFMHNWTNIL